MKPLLTLALFISCLMASAQAPKKGSVIVSGSPTPGTNAIITESYDLVYDLSAYEKQTIKAQEEHAKQVARFQAELKRIDSVYNKFIVGLISAVTEEDFNRVSIHPDSLKLEDGKLKIIYRKKKQ